MAVRKKGSTRDKLADRAVGMEATLVGDGTGQSNAEPRPRCDLTVWLADLTYTQQAISADLIPQAVGGIGAYTESRVDMARSIRIFKYPEKLAAALAQDGFPDVIGFSSYIWNSSLSSAFARRIKELSPKTVVVFGGPHYPVLPEYQEAFLRERPEVDFYIVKEGELAFANIVAALAENGNRPELLHGRLTSTHSIAPDGTAHLTEVIERIRDLTEIPSPYVSGRMDEFFDGKLLPIIQTNRGCPFSCTFCIEGVRYYNKVYKNSQEKVAAEIDYIGHKMQEVRSLGGRNDLFIADSNFGMYKDDLETCRSIARAQERYDWPEYINVATGKNQKERVLAAAKLINGALRLSGSVQNLDPEVLANIKRANIGADELMKLALEAADIGANSYSEVILALPGDSKERHYETLRQVIKAGFNMVSTFQLMMLPGSEMCTEEHKKKYGMTTRYRVYPRCYGHYDIRGRRIVSAEVEEICVALDTLSFEDYLECRKMHLMIAIFHNDGIFGTLLKFLRANGYSVFRWLELLCEAEPTGGLKVLFDDFLRDTREELWDSRQELEAFIQEPGTIERLIDGELGNNLLFTYKTKAVTGHVAEMAELARRTIRTFLEEVDAAQPETLRFIDDALVYHGCRMTNVFSRLDEDVTARLRYDITAYENDSSPGPLSDYLCSPAAEFGFVLSEDQKDMVRRYLKVFGDTPWGIGRMMTKVYVKRLLRRPARADAVPNKTNPGALGWGEIDDKPAHAVAGGTRQG